MVNTLLVVASVLAAICVPIVVLTHRSLMPTPAQLHQLDELVRQQVPPDSRVNRLSAPDRIDLVGDVKTGHFTYVISDKTGDRKLLVNWHIQEGNIQIVSGKR